MTLVEYIENNKYGKIAHFIDDMGIHLFARVIEDNDSVIYDEFDNEIQEELRKEYFDDED